MGRRLEVSQVKRLLSESRLVTLTGPGGVGKTRLALRAAADIRRSFPDGTYFVDLVPLASPELVVHAVAEAVDLIDHSSKPPLESLIEGLSTKQTLLILDSCEHLLGQCARMADTLLRAAPGLRILATSRQAMGIHCERTLVVPALPLMSAGSAFVPSESARLFAERARAVLPDFTITDDNRDKIEQVCRRIDGIPLAIEMAAPRLRVLSVGQLLDRLDDRFGLLTTRSPIERRSHRTLRALFDWSHDLCTDQERLMWARVSVFAGGLDLDAAEAVCAGEDIAGDKVLDLVAGLVEKSVLVREECPWGVRYRLLETIRQYGGERLAASGEEAALRRRHRDYYQRLAARVRAEMFGPSQVTWFSRLQVEHPNLRAAMAYSLADPAEADRGVAMAADLLYFWIRGFRAREGRRWFDQGLAIATEATEDRARGLCGASWLAIIGGDAAAARSMLEESREIGEKLGLKTSLAYTELYSGMLAMNCGDIATAITQHEEAVERFRAVDDPPGLAVALNRLSLCYTAKGDFQRAIAIGEENVRICRDAGEQWHKAYGNMALGVAFWMRADIHRATKLAKESLRFNCSINDPVGGGVSLEVLAWIAASKGQYERAGRLLGATQPIWELLGTSLSAFKSLVRYHDECESRIREALGEPGYLAAVEKGLRLSMEEACAFACGEPLPRNKQPERKTQSPRLTSRELEVARLVAQGMSNKKIASSLVIAERTAEGHIERILSKLGFNSRTQIAVWLKQQGPDSG